MFEAGVRSQLTVADVPSLVGGLAALDLGDLTDARRVELIGVLESLKGAAAGVQARLAVDFAESQEAQSQRQSHGASRRSVAAQVALARRESAHRGSRHLGLARTMVREMPHTMGHLAAGRVSEWRATIVCRETACLSVADRAAVDAALAADLPTLGDRQLQSRARALAARLDATAMARRAARAPHRVRVRTPTGATYDSTAPPPLQPTRPPTRADATHPTPPGSNASSSTTWSSSLVRRDGGASRCAVRPALGSASWSRRARWRGG